MKKISIVILLALSILLVQNVYATDVTSKQKIERVQYNGTAKVLYFVGETKWGAANCPNATYVAINSDVPGIKEIMSLGLSAKMAGVTVEFWGECASNPDYFNAFYIIVE